MLKKIGKAWGRRVRGLMGEVLPSRIRTSDAGRKRAHPDALRRAIETLEPRVLFSAGMFSNAVNHPLGNFSSIGLTFNGGTKISNLPYSPRLGLTSPGTVTVGSAFTTAKYSINRFSTDFSFQLSGPTADGIAFVIDGISANSIGVGGNGLGYTGLAQSVAIEFNASGGNSVTGLGTNGAFGATTDLAASNINLGGGHQFNVHMEYDGSTLSVSETDATTAATATQNYTSLSIKNTVGAALGYVGFTGAADTNVSSNEVLTWAFADVVPTENDIGSPVLAGTSVYSNATVKPSLYTVKGVGTSIGSTSDQFHLTSRTLSGDGTITAQILSLQNTGAAAEAGVMLRDGTAANAAFAAVLYSPTNGISFQYRTSAGSNTVQPTGLTGISAPYFVRVVRDGPNISGYASPTGANGTWVLLGTAGFSMPDKVAAGLAACAGSAAVVSNAVFKNVSVSRDVPLGADTGSAGRDYTDLSEMWVNVVNQASGFVLPGTGTPATVDASGWPTQDFQTNLFLEQSNTGGVYHLSMVCNQNPIINVAFGTVSNQQYNAGTKTVTADVNLSAGSGQVVVLSASNTGGGATNIKFIRPGYDPVNPPVFTDVYLNFMKALGPNALRFMGYLAANDNPVQTWDQRAKPSDATQTRYALDYTYGGVPSTFGWQSKGASWEYAILLSNLLHTDMWINIPAEANDDYITQLASLIKNGDTVNGVNYAGLSPDLNVYIESSNEAWNPAFNVHQWNIDAATAEISAGIASGNPSSLDYDNRPITDGYTFGVRYFARRLMQTANIFGSVFGQDAVTKRIRPVLANRPDVGEMTEMLSFINNVYGTPGQWFYAVSNAIYMNMNGPNNTTNTLNGGNRNPNLTASDVLQTFVVNAVALTNLYDTLAGFAKTYGIRTTAAYEAGVDTTGFEDTGYNGAKALAQRDPRIEGVITQDMELWYAHGGGEAMWFVATAQNFGYRYGDFGITENITNTTGAKVVGFQYARTAQRAPIVPSVPTGLAVSQLAANQVSVTWNAPGDASVFHLDYSIDNTFSSNVVTLTIAGAKRSVIISNLPVGTNYSFRIRGANTAGDSGNGVGAGITLTGTLPKPGAPTNVMATAFSSSQINLKWTDTSRIETAYHIDIATDAAFTQNFATLAALVDATSFSAYGLNAATKYYFRVRAVNAAGEGVNAAVVNATTPPAVPVALYHFDEASGFTAIDSAANPDFGALVGGVTHVPGISGNALSFNGTTGYVDLFNPFKLSITGQITISAWIKPNSVVAPADIVTKDWDGINTPYYLRLNNSNTVVFGTYRYLFQGVPAFEAIGTNPTPLTDGQWHLVVGSYDGAALKIYIDGQLRGGFADPYGASFGTQNVNIGRNSNAGGGSHNYFNGLIDEVAIYNNGMSAADVLAAAGASPNQTEDRLFGTSIGTPGLIFRYVYDGDFSTSVQGPSNGTWVGLDLGSRRQVTEVQYAPAFGQGNLMVGGYIQGSNTADFSSGVVTLYQIPSAPSDGHLTTAIITNSGGYRFVRYLSPDGSNGKIAELRFWGGLPGQIIYPAQPSSLTAAAKSTTEIDLNWTDNSTVETGSVVERATDPSFSSFTTFTINQANVTSYADTTASPGATYFYRVQATNAVGSSAFSNAASATTLAGGEIVIDNTQATVVGAWTSGSGLPGFYGPDYLFDAFAGGKNDSVTYSAGNLPAGSYQVFGRWTASGNRATNVPIDILHSGVVDTAIVNEQTNGGVWVPLGIYSFDGTAASVTIRTTGTINYVIADAVRFVPVSNAEIVVDDAQATLTGVWNPSTSTSGFYDTDYLTDGNINKGSNTATFTPTLPSSGTYQVYGWWTSGTNRATNTPFDINTTGGIQTVLVDETQPGSQWVLLGTFSLDAGAYVTIRTDGTNGYVVADAVKFTRIGA